MESISKAIKTLPREDTTLLSYSMMIDFRMPSETGDQSRQMKAYYLGNTGNEMETIWKFHGNCFPVFFVRNLLKLANQNQPSMHKTLVIEAFEKAELELKKEGKNNPSKVSISEKLSTYISENTNTQLGERRLRDYYDEGKKIENSKDDINISQQNVVEALSHYLGYDCYHYFVNKTKNRKYRLPFLILVLGTVAFILIIYLNVNTTCWMEWQKDHYEKVAFDAEKLSNGSLKLYKEERLKYFTKIDSPNCDTPFFKEDGSVNTWYGKNKNGNLEVFTSLGLHPETGKTLRPVTQYMIDKYWCKE